MGSRRVQFCLLTLLAVQVSAGELLLSHSKKMIRNFGNKREVLNEKLNKKCQLSESFSTQKLWNIFIEIKM